MADDNQTVSIVSTVQTDPSSLVVAICVVVAVGGIMGILMLVFVICFGEKSAKQAEISSYHSYSRDTELLRDSSIIVLDSAELCDADHLVSCSQHPQPSPSIFRRGDFVAEVMQEVNEGSTNTDNKDEGNTDIATASVYEQSKESGSTLGSESSIPTIANRTVEVNQKNGEAENRMSALGEIIYDSSGKVEEVEVNNCAEFCEGSLDTGPGNVEVENYMKTDANNTSYGNPDNFPIETVNVSNDGVDESGSCKVLTAPEMKVDASFKYKHKCGQNINFIGSPNSSIPLTVHSPSTPIVSILGARLCTGHNMSQQSTSCNSPLPPTSISSYTNSKEYTTVYSDK